MNFALLPTLVIALTANIAPVMAEPESKPSGQVMQHSFTIEGTEGQPFNLAELSAVIAKQNDTLRVLFAGDADMRPKEYKDIDFRTGDIILMANGKKMNSTEELQEVYEGIAIGKEVEFGIRRDGKLQLVTFLKADPKNLPARQMTMVTDDGKGGKSVASRKIMMDGKEFQAPEGVTDVQPLFGLGLLLGNKDGKVVVAGIMPFAKEKGDLDGVNVLDLVTSFNGKPISSVTETSSAYEALKVGDKFTIGITRGSEKIEISLSKPEDTGMKVIRN